MLIHVLISILTLEVIISLVLFKCDIISPAFLFSVCFLIASVVLKYNINYWKVNISDTTVTLVTEGVAAFILGCFLINITKFGIKVLKNKKTETCEGLQEIVINKNVIMIFICFYVVVELLMILSIRSIAIAKGGTGSLPHLIGYYNNLAKNENNSINLPVLLNQGIVVCIYMGFVWAYILINNMLYNKKFNGRVFLLYVLSCACGMISGSRGDAIMIIFSSFIMYVILSRKKNHKKLLKVSFKGIIIGVVVFYFVIITFQSVALILGRDAHLYEANEYLSIYTGGPLLNFNNCLRKGFHDSVYWGQETFMYMNKTIGKIIGNVQMQQYKTTRVFYQANYHNTGNVCTTFYEFYYDFGKKGVILLSLLMGIIAQWIYNITKKSIQSKSGLDFNVLIYSYIAFLVFRCFFGNSFWGQIITLQFLKVVLIWWLSVKFIDRLRVKI